MTAVPEQLRLHPDRDRLTLVYAEAEHTLSAEFLRVYSPSAEVRGHGPGQETLQTGKRLVKIDGLEAVGNYAVKIAFSDGHDSGLYDWDYLHGLCRNREALWRDYLGRLAAAGAGRDAGPAAPAGACGGSCGCKH